MKIMIDDSMLVGADLIDKSLEIMKTLFYKARTNKDSAKIVEFVKLELLAEWERRNFCVKFKIVLNPFQNSEEYRKIKFFVIWLGDNELSYNKPPEHTLRLVLSSSEPEIVADGLIKIMQRMLLEKSNLFKTEGRFLENMSSNF
ncbi:hypothetical protein GW888_00930 [Candidatus Wolfebacteria bacterium]|nr:hypothetical protein [Candidatus Wolfebacteria bacterium]